jgi:hypothetical protein
VLVRQSGLGYTEQKYSKGRSYWDTPIIDLVSYRVGYVEIKNGKLNFCFLETDKHLQMFRISVVMDEVFPLREGVDYKRLKLTAEGEYSVTRRRDADRIISIIKTVLKDTKTRTITDATGCVGGDTIHFALHFQKVDSIEINPSNFEALENNVEVYGLTNVSLHLGDAVNVFQWKTDMLYIDPPWGGPNYKEIKNLDLYMSSKRIDQWLEEILLRKNRPNYVVLKLPQNYNFTRLNFLSNVDYIKPYRIRSYVLVVITVHMPKN